MDFFRRMAQKITMPDDRQLAPFRFSQHVRIGARPRNNPPLAVGHDAQTVTAGIIPQRTQCIRCQALFVQAFPGLIFDDGSAVKGDDITAETVEAQSPGYGIDALRRTTRRQDKLHALFL